MHPITPTDLKQLPSIKLQSPLAIIGAFLYLIRNRFAAGARMPWEWHADYTTTGILVEAQYNETTEVRDNRPGVFVDRDQTSYGKVSLGNLDQAQPLILQRQLTHFMSVGQTDLLIDCVSTSRGESMQIADAVQGYIEASRYIIMGVFGFRDISPIVMGRTATFAKQTDLHQTTLNFRVEYETHWATAPAYPVLRGLGIHLKESDGQGVNTYLANIYLDSTK